MATNLTIHANVGVSDLPLNSSGYTGWVQIDTVNDFIIFTAGSNTIADAQPLPSVTQLSNAGIVLTGSEITIDKYFLADSSVNQILDIDNMGVGNFQYVLAFSFDGATVAEPSLELWDNINLNTINNTSLGGGVASGSWFRGITTTSASSGVSWVGSRLAGSANGNFLFLNDLNGGLTGANVLYCQLKVVVPASQVDSGAETPVIAIKYTTT